MRHCLLCMVGLTIVATAFPVRADPPAATGDEYGRDSARLKKEEGTLEQMQANRRLDNAHSDQTQTEFRAGTAELSGHDAQQLQNVQNLRTAEGQVTAGQTRETLAHQSYKDAVQKYGAGDQRSTAARLDFNESRQAMKPLLQNRKTSRQNVHDGRRMVHNDRTVLSIQKRSMDSDARYRAHDDRKIKKKEKDIAHDRNELDSNVVLREPSR